MRHERRGIADAVMEIFDFLFVRYNVKGEGDASRFTGLSISACPRQRLSQHCL